MSATSRAESVPPRRLGDGLRSFRSRVLRLLALLQVALLWSCVPVLFDDRCGPEYRATYVNPTPVPGECGCAS